MCLDAAAKSPYIAACGGTMTRCFSDLQRQVSDTEHNLKIMPRSESSLLQFVAALQQDRGMRVESPDHCSNVS
jgi:hypothetical protein